MKMMAGEAVAGDAFAGRFPLAAFVSAAFNLQVDDKYCEEGRKLIICYLLRDSVGVITLILS